MIFATLIVSSANLVMLLGFATVAVRTRIKTKALIAQALQMSQQPAQPGVT
jgi:hypothetical protein